MLPFPTATDAEIDLGVSGELKIPVIVAEDANLAITSDPASPRTVTSLDISGKVDIGTSITFVKLWLREDGILEGDSVASCGMFFGGMDFLFLSTPSPHVPCIPEKKTNKILDHRLESMDHRCVCFVLGLDLALDITGSLHMEAGAKMTTGCEIVLKV